MDTGQELAPPRADESPPPIPPAVRAEAPSSPAVPGRPTADAVLRWVAAADPEPWFPSDHARTTGTPRDALDEPLAELRLGELVRVAEWVRGRGQGYALTPEGRMAAADPAALGLLQDFAPQPLPDETPAEPSTDPNAPSSVIDLRPPLVTPALLGANIIWFFVGLVVARRLGIALTSYLMSGDPGVLERQGAVSGPDLLRGEWWRLATCCFVHVGGVHLVLNMVVLGMLGPLAELVWGRGRIAVIYAIGGVAGSCVAMAARPVTEGGVVVLLAGASGAIWGVQAALLAWLLLFRVYLPRELSSDWFRRLGLMFAVNAGASLLPGVSWEAHLGGGVAGFVAAGLLNALRFGERRHRLAALAALLALPAASVGVLLAAMEQGHAWAQLRGQLMAQEEARRIAAFNREVAPRAEELRPDLAKKVERRAVLVLVGGTKSRAEGIPAAREQGERFRAACTDLANELAAPTGFSTVDARREKLRAYLDARVRSLELLLRLLDAKELPSSSAWRTWGDARREADRLWDELGPR